MQAASTSKGVFGSGKSKSKKQKQVKQSKKPKKERGERGERIAKLRRRRAPVAWRRKLIGRSKKKGGKRLNLKTYGINKAQETLSTLSPPTSR